MSQHGVACEITISHHFFCHKLFFYLVCDVSEMRWGILVLSYEQESRQRIVLLPIVNSIRFPEYQSVVTCLAILFLCSILGVGCCSADVRFVYHSPDLSQVLQNLYEKTGSERTSEYVFPEVGSVRGN